MVGLAVLGTVLGLLGLNIWAVVDVARRPDGAWKAIGADKTLWLLLVLLTGLPAAIAYLAAIRPRFDRLALAPAQPHAIAAPAGWYPDPSMPGYVRYFDGTWWTTHVTPSAFVVPPGGPGAGPPTRGWPSDPR